MSPWDVAGSRSLQAPGPTSTPPRSSPPMSPPSVSPPIPTARGHTAPAQFPSPPLADAMTGAAAEGQPEFPEQPRHIVPTNALVHRGPEDSPKPLSYTPSR